jgi:hypothetical protein
MHPKILKGLGLGLSFKFLEYLSFVFEFEYFANLLQISKKIIYFLSMDLGFNFDFFPNF